MRRWTTTFLARADAAMNRLYGWRYNPLYHSGALVVALLIVLLVTGVYLLFFYRLGAPYESVARLAADPWLGRWIRGLHRYASDAAVVAALVHALRLYAQGRSWGPRTLAWVTGSVLLFAVLVCGWTGFVMVWDVQGQVLAQAGARLLDALPIFAEPIGRAFVGERPLPGAFFFLNLFAHIALPIGLGLLVWLHVSRVARPGLLPPRQLMWGVIGLLGAAAVIWPAALGPVADLFRRPGPAPYDWFYAFWVPLLEPLPAVWAWAAFTGAVLVLVLVPLWTRPAAAVAPPPSFVDENLCSGCEQCYQDCPYEAIAMIPRSGGATGRSEEVAHVNPALCVSCGICAGSCAPMGVGPPGRTGRDQLAGVRAFAAARRPPLGARDVVVVSCDRAARAAGGGAPGFTVTCAGNLHTSIVEFLLRSGAGGVLIVSCPPRDCWSREGPKWLEERLYHDREAELQVRVDRRRVRLIHASAAQPELVAGALEQFRGDVAQLIPAALMDEDQLLERECTLDEATR